MKHILLTMGFLFVFNANATIEYSAREESTVSTQEINKNRACFKQLETFGCGDPGEDLEHFRSCMNNVYSSLDDHCKKMMTNLYGKK